MEGIIEPEETKLICAYKEDKSMGFKSFEEQMLLTNPLFTQVITIRHYNLYVFDYQTYTDDWFNFLLGKYSKLSPVLKRAIKTYYGDTSGEYSYIETYLYPEKYFDTYAKLLDVNPRLLKETGELCDPCDLEKETLKIPVEDLVLLQKSV